MSDQIKNVSDASFDADVLKSGQPVLVDYWAAWCGPCKMIAPILEEVATEYAGRLTIAKLNVDENQGTATNMASAAFPPLCSLKTAKPPPPKLARCRSRNSPHSWTARCKLRAVNEGAALEAALIQYRASPSVARRQSPPLLFPHQSPRCTSTN